MLFGQLIFDGLAMGLIFVILAAGLLVIINGTKIFFLAYGSFYTIGAYVTWWAINQLNMPYFLSLIFALLIATIIAALSYVLIFHRLQLNAGGFMATMIASLGLYMFLNQANLLTFGTSPRSIPAIFPGTLHFLGINITVDKLVLIVISVSVTLFLFWVYEKTAIGRAIRAVSFSPEAASLQGLNVSLIYIAVLGIGCSLAAFAGGILAPSYGITPQMGASVLWSVMLVTMLGGFGSLLGAVVGGLLVGQILSFGQFYLGGTSQLVLFIIIGIIGYFKPMGLVGRGIDIEV